MYIQKLEIYSKQLHETTQKLHEAISKLDVESIKELSVKIESLGAKVAKYSEKAQTEISRTVSKIENGQLTNYRMFSDEPRNVEDIDRMTSIKNEVNELIIDMVVNKVDNMEKILKLNDEYVKLGATKNFKGYSLSLEFELKTKGTWKQVTGHEPITMIDFTKLTFKKTSKAPYLYKNENERYLIN